MMYESPFDVAIYPLMTKNNGEDGSRGASPAVVKLQRWSSASTEMPGLTSASSMTMMTTHDEEQQQLLTEDKGGLLEDDEDDEETIVFQKDAMLNMELVILEERHKDIVEINHDMKQINEISKDLAELVDSQEENVKRMSWLAIEAFEHSECGFEQLVQANRSASGRKSSWSSKQYLVWMGALAIVAAWAFWQQSVDGAGEWAAKNTGSGTDNIRTDSTPVIHIHESHSKLYP